MPVSESPLHKINQRSRWDYVSDACSIAGILLAAIVFVKGLGWPLAALAGLLLFVGALTDRLFGPITIILIAMAAMPLLRLWKWWKDRTDNGDNSGVDDART